MTEPNLTQRLAGMADIFPEDAAHWVRMEGTVREVMRQFGFGEIRCPIMEPTELFERGTGSSTDIVQKEMYTFTDRGDRSVTLRPEGTPSVVRAWLEESLGTKRPTWKFFYIGPMFRAERPQQGRLRQFHQIGAELLGAADPAADIEVIALGDALFRALGLGATSLILNSIGSAEARVKLNAALRTFLEQPEIQKVICGDCKRRAQTNPLRVFDCKIETCQSALANAPAIDSFLTDEDRRHFATVREGLEQLGIGHAIDLRMVRGLDYYSRTTFEFRAAGIGSQDAICGGGRYDGLVEVFGGPPTPAVGFAAGCERVLASMPPFEAGQSSGCDVFVCTLGEKAGALAPMMLGRLRTLGLSADRDFLGRGLKAQMKEADRSGARVALIVGDDEIAKRQFALRRMATSAQSEITSTLGDWTKEMFA